MDVEHAQLSLLDRSVRERERERKVNISAFLSLSFSRWQVKIEHRRYLGLKRGAKVITMNNYLGIGCDAGIALNFHRQRETRPELFKSRIINKVATKCMSTTFSHAVSDTLSRRILLIFLLLLCV